MKRRLFMRTGITGPLVLAATPAIAQSLAKDAKTYVLVPGTWCGGWFMRPVAAELRAKGHHVFTPTHTGLGERKQALSR